MKWSEINCGTWRHSPYDENEQTVRGSLLVSFGVDLEEVPDIFFEECKYYNKKGRTYNEYNLEKVFVEKIIGSSYDMYSNIPWIETFQKIKRANDYILSGCVTKKIYLKQMKKPPICEFDAIKLSKNEKSYFVDGNGNNRVTLYKMMYYSEISKYGEVQNDWSIKGRKTTNNNYWLYALVRTEI